MKSVPIYALYGEMEADRQQDWLHWESIQSRSRLHDYLISPHRHEQFFQVLSFTGGRAQVTLDGAVFDLAPPATVIVPALTVHAYAFSDDIEGVVLTMMARDVRATGVDAPRAGVILGTGAVTEAIAALVAEADRPGEGHGVAMRALLTLLVVAISRARQDEEQVVGEAHDRGARHAQAFRDLVDERYRQTRSVQDYAQALGISPTHLNRVSRQVLGTSALAVIERRVALEARRQLMFSTMTIKQIGAELGYDDPAYFTRVLKRMLGVSPGLYRQQMQGHSGGAERNEP